MVRLLLSHARPELARLSAWLDEQERVLAMSERVAYAVRLCLEEAVANLIDHAQAVDGSDIVVGLEWHGGALVVSVEDSGPPFDLRAAPVPAKPESLETAIPGGWGIQLIRAFASEIDYKTNAGRNRLTLRFAPASGERDA